MAFKKLNVELLDADGKGVAGVPVKASGCMELNSSPLGTALFLLEESPVAIEIDGKQALSMTLDELPPKLSFVQDGGGWKPR